MTDRITIFESKDVRFERARKVVERIEYSESSAFHTMSQSPDGKVFTEWFHCEDICAAATTLNRALALTAIRVKHTNITVSLTGVNVEIKFRLLDKTDKRPFSG